METASMIAPAKELGAAVVAMYFTGLSPLARVRACALVGVRDKVMAMIDVASAKMRGLFMTISPVEGALANAFTDECVVERKKGQRAVNLS
jgi:hypothetical protein